jgi:predicted AAA+ superfamily ATPase
MARHRYISRIIDSELDSLLPILPAIALEGAKGVGKTATAARRAVTVHALDRPGALDLAGADPQRLISGRRPVLIDEWQRMPQSWDLVRRAVDADPSPGQFLLAGSASPRTPGTHSGAGRIVRLKMRPLSLIERTGGIPTVSLGHLLRGKREPVVGSTPQSLDDYAAEVCASGLPGLRGMHPRAIRAELDGYLDLITDRDFAEMGQTVRRPGTLRRWMTAYAAATATTASYDVVRDAATPGDGEKPAKTTIQVYRDILERLWILEPLPAWLPTHNHLRRLSAAPKHHLVDPALAARLLGVDTSGLLDARSARPSIARDTTLIGQLFESLITLSVRVYAQAAEARVNHLRTHAGEHEVDLIVERGDHRILAIEIKLAATVGDRDVRHLRWLAERVGADLLDAVVITTGADAYRRPDGVAVVPAALLGP